MTDKEKAQIIGEVFMDLREVEQELACLRAKSARISGELENVANHLKHFADSSPPFKMPDGDFSLEGIGPKQLMERIMILCEKQKSLKERLEDLGGGIGT